MNTITTMINSYTLSFFIIILVFFFFNLYNYKCKDILLNATIKCYDKGLYKTCIFSNIYYYNQKWIIYSDKYKYSNLCVNAYAKSLGECWKPNVYSFKNNRRKKMNINKIYYGLTVPFKLTYKNNYAHALWDDLYSVYTSIVKCGYKNENFNFVIYNKHPKTHFINDMYSVIKIFSNGENIYLNHLKNELLLFKNLIVGSSHQCQRCITLDYSLKYSREYNITKLYRDRMYKMYNIIPKYEYPIQGIIVHNKRYNQYEISLLKNITKYFQNSKIIKLYYIDFRNITTFYDQLKLLSKIHIYISGPGSGLLNFPFISDPGVIIHLGHIHFGCPQYLEQYMLEGSPHYKAIYYSSQKRMNIMNYTYVINLIENAIKFIKNNKEIYIRKEENLNLEGKLFIKICKEYKEICEKLINYYDWGYGKCRGIWAENVVYFPSLYNKIPELKKIVIYFNSTQHLGCKVATGYSKQKQCKI